VALAEVVHDTLHRLIHEVAEDEILRMLSHPRMLIMRPSPQAQTLVVVAKVGDMEATGIDMYLHQYTLDQPPYFSGDAELSLTMEGAFSFYCNHERFSFN